MALLQLLSVGRSLSEARDRPHRYKLRTGAMPSFGQSGAGVLERSGAEQTVQSERENQTIERAQRMNSETTIESRPAGKQTFPFGRWSARPSAGRSVSRSAVRAVVQGELRLDTVKPVRNDLSDSDLELVSRKPARHVEPASNVFAAPAAQTQPKLSLWTRLKRWLPGLRTK